MNIEPGLVLQGLAASLTVFLAFALCFQLLRRALPASYTPVALSHLQLALNHSRLASEKLVLRREDQNEAPRGNRIEDRVIACISQALIVDESRVVPSASLIDDLQADSLSLIEMVMILEEEFGIQISDEDAEAIRTVRQTVEYVTHALNMKGRQSL